MDVLGHVIQLLPKPLLSWAKRLRSRSSLFNWLTQEITERYRHQSTTISRGIGTGLKFNPHGGNLGFALGTSEIEEQHALAHYLKPGSTFYDIGANKGFYAVLGARLVGSAGHVYAFEPFPESAEAIRHNVALNDFHNVTVFEAAISDTTTQGQFLVTGDSVQFKLASSRNAPNSGESQSIGVKVWSTDQIVETKSLRPPDFVLIDVEGSEIEALRGMRNTIEQHRPVILCEIHWLKREVEEIVADLFEPLDYQVSRLDGSRLPEEVTRYHMLLHPA